MTFMNLNRLNKQMIIILLLFYLSLGDGKWVDEGGSKYRKLIYIDRQHLGRRWGVWGGRDLRIVTQE